MFKPGSSPKNFTTPLLAGLLIIAAFFLGTFWTRVKYLESGGTQKIAGEQFAAQPDSAVADQPVAPPVEVAKDVFDQLVKGATVLAGSDSAPVKVVEFSDFQCPFCARFFEQSLSNLDEKYIQTGQVQYLYRHFPLTGIHANAMGAALASECAAEQNQFQAFHDTIFKNQESITIADLKTYAGQIGLNQSQFDSCLDSKKYQSRIDADMKLGQDNGVTGTPTFFVNGKVVNGAVPFATFEQTLKEVL